MCTHNTKHCCTHELSVSCECLSGPSCVQRAGKLCALSVPKESSLCFLFHLGKGKQPRARNTGRLRALAEDFLAGFTLGFRQSHVGSSIFTRSAAGYPCGIAPKGGKTLWGGKGASKTAVPDFPKSFHKCCEPRMSVRNLAFGGIEVKLAVRLHLAHLGRSIEAGRSCSVQCLLPRQSLGYGKELCRVGGSSWEGWRVQSVKAKLCCPRNTRSEEFCISKVVSPLQTL